MMDKIAFAAKLEQFIFVQNDEIASLNVFPTNCQSSCFMSMEK